MKKIKPNSLESIILFSVYISAQDGNVSDQEIKELIIEAPVLKKLYFDIYGEYMDLDMLDLTSKVLSFLEPRSEYIGRSVSKTEESFFTKLITDPKIQDITLLVARHMASADGLHDLESSKFSFWSKKWITE